MPVAYSVVFTQTARAELIGAQGWYEDAVPGLGRRFRAEIDALIERISAHPLQFPAVYGKVRRALVRRFPYMLFFIVEGDTLLVIACFHASRDPRRWQERV